MAANSANMVQLLRELKSKLEDDTVGVNQVINNLINEEQRLLKSIVSNDDDISVVIANLIKTQERLCQLKDGMVTNILKIGKTLLTWRNKREKR